MRNLLKNALGINKEQKLNEFEALAFPIMDRLYSTALRMTKDPLEAEDLVQDTYMRAWLYFDNFEPGTNFHGWIFRILTNNFINECRNKKRAPSRADFEMTCATFASDTTNEIDKNNEPEFNTNYQELFEDNITAALDKLPEHYRITVLLSDVNDLKYKEIAEVLDCPIGTVMSRINRGRQILAKSLKRYAQKNGYAEPSEL